MTCSNWLFINTVDCVAIQELWKHVRPLGWRMDNCRLWKCSLSFSNDSVSLLHLLHLLWTMPRIVCQSMIIIQSFSQTFVNLFTVQSWKFGLGWWYEVFFLVLLTRLQVCLEECFWHFVNVREAACGEALYVLVVSVLQSETEKEQMS